jgi:hypothetical protein
MPGSLITLPVRVGVRCAGLALRGTYAVTERALGLAGSVAGSIIRPDSPDVDLDGTEHRPDATYHDATPVPVDAPPAPATPVTVDAPPAPATPVTVDAPPAPATPVPVDTPPVDAPLPPLDGPAHVSEEAEIVETVAEPGAEDGAGAEVHVAEPWNGYREMKADDVIDRITGATVAELAAVELYELSGRSRQSVIDAVRRELNRSQRAT